MSTKIIISSSFRELTLGRHLTTLCALPCWILSFAWFPGEIVAKSPSSDSPRHHQKRQRSLHGNDFALHRSFLGLNDRPIRHSIPFAFDWLKKLFLMWWLLKVCKLFAFRKRLPTFACGTASEIFILIHGGRTFDISVREHAFWGRILLV